MKKTLLFSVCAVSYTHLDVYKRQDRMLEALRTNFEQDEEMRQYLLACDKFGNNIRKADEEAAQIVERTAAIVASQKNYLGNPFRPDFSSPSTHLMYGYWVGATPDGRKAREMLNYGVDPLFGEDVYKRQADIRSAMGRGT